MHAEEPQRLVLGYDDQEKVKFEDAACRDTQHHPQENLRHSEDGRHGDVQRDKEEDVNHLLGDEGEEQAAAILRGKIVLLV